MGGLFSRLFRSKQYNLLIIGLDNAGKTTLVQKMMNSSGAVAQTIPTIGLNVEETKFRNLRFVLWDLSGQRDQRNTWRHYYVGTNALIFVVDATDRKRIIEAKNEFDRVMEEQQLAGLPCLMFVNKSDVSKAMSSAKIIKKFEINSEQLPHLRIQACSAITGLGLNEGLTWLSNELKHK
ncbi:MAG: putative ADP-ribosylation factor 1 [Streblomastix strix]|uniref:Putative ADP-ribosylation factor 1 n=1 Tax=Streblomastix strix TaxID=222440 RepID=A0A5J4XA88_9EUKA|nr:MAG: putative ADP-ribosylation factor 1 [Streblomastix strix]